MGNIVGLRHYGPVDIQGTKHTSNHYNSEDFDQTTLVCQTEIQMPIFCRTTCRLYPVIHC